jgi:putative two-component system response regulator
MRAEQELGSTDFLQMAREIAYTHHERWDGMGYPMGLKGDEIPICGRLMAIADVYDALISKRVYKEAYSHEKAVEIVRQSASTHLDPDIVEAFLQLEGRFREVMTNYRDD